MTFAKLILRHLDARGWSQLELARRTGLARQNVGGFCRGVIPGDDALAKLLAALELDESDQVDLVLTAKADGSPLAKVWASIRARLSDGSEPPSPAEVAAYALLRSGSKSDRARLVTLLQMEKAFRYANAKGSRGLPARVIPDTSSDTKR